MIENKYPFTSETTLEQLKIIYNDLMRKIELENTRAKIIVQVKMITTKINLPENYQFDPECLEICRKIKAVTEACELI
ncbi:hypothetical protein RyT2_16300 [Pseudolactococcus yaeyamensis]